jgi:YihY family inner membrane protein
MPADRFDRFQREHRWFGYPLAVVYKYVDDQGGYLAALITYYGFLSLFPLLLALSTILGIVLNGHPHLQQEVLNSAFAQFPVIGKELGQPRQLGGGVTALVIGFLGTLYGSMGVGQAVQNAMNTAWHVPRNDRPNPFKVRGRSLLLLLTTGLVVLGTTVLTVVRGTISDLGGVTGLLTIVLSVVLNAGVFTLAFRIATARDLSWRQVAPGAFAAAIGWQILQKFGGDYVRHVVAHSSATNSVFALVLGLIAFLYVAAVMFMLCVEVDVVRVNRLYPRSLLTPFTDDVDLTRGDRATYRGAAKAQRNKGFEDIHVHFHPQPKPPSDSEADR